MDRSGDQLLITGAITAGSAPWWWPPVHRAVNSALGRETTAFSGGCGGYQLYAQNRWSSTGASIRRAPDALSAKVGGFGPNEIVAVDGSIHSKVAYPNNPSPWDSDVWFHLADDRGWVALPACEPLEVTLIRAAGRRRGHRCSHYRQLRGQARMIHGRWPGSAVRYPVLPRRVA
jgi:hypothetical protein